jgi:hypothetical protein
MVTLLAALCLAAPQTDFPLTALGIGSVRTIDGTTISISSPKVRATVFFFITTDCPIANRYAPDMSRIAKDYSVKGFAFARVYAEPAISTAEIIRHSEEFSLTKIPAISDAKHNLVNKIHAKVTPEAAVVSVDGRLLYRGRIDDSYTDHGRFNSTPSRRDLREALSDILAGRVVRVKNVPAVGCDIPNLR